jgi:hypothetical protein
MNLSVELILVLLIVGAAVVALGRRFYRFITQSGRNASACGSSCGGCASQADDIKSSLKPLVQLDLNTDKNSSAAGR